MIPPAPAGVSPARASTAAGSSLTLCSGAGIPFCMYAPT